MARPVPPRKQVDLRTLPFAARATLVAATIVVVLVLVLTFGDPGRSATVPAAAIAAALCAFAVVAWRAQRRR